MNNFYKGDYDDISTLANIPNHQRGFDAYSYCTSQEVAKILNNSINNEKYPERASSIIDISTSDDMRHMGEVFA